MGGLLNREGTSATTEEDKKYKYEAPGIWENIVSRGKASSDWREAEYRTQRADELAGRYNQLEQQFRPSQSMQFGADGGLLQKFGEQSTPQIQYPQFSVNGILNQIPMLNQQAPIAPMPQQQYSPEFFVRAAGIPGYEQLAQGAQTQMGAMDRQVQQQGYEGSNMSLYQRTMSGIQEAQQAATERHQKAQEAISAGHLDVARKQLELQQGKQKGLEATLGKPTTGHMWIENPDSPYGYSQTPIPGTDDWRKGNMEVEQIDSGMKGLVQLKNQINKYGSMELFGKGRGSARAAESGRQAAITALGVLSNMGVLQPGDLDRLTNLLPDPTTYNPISNNAANIAAINETLNRLDTAYKARLRAMPSLKRPSSKED